VERTQNRLHVLVHDLRQVLEPDPANPQILLREGEGYRFAPQVPYLLDVERFEQLLHQGDSLEGTAALEAYRQALALYKGDFLADEPYADWAELERAYLRERAVGALLRTANIALSLNQRREALEAYRHILKLDPWREEAYRALMLQLTNSGQEPEARSLFNQYRARMEREGLPVDPELAQMVRVSI
jgi:two-component SAPR family response regulator